MDIAVISREDSDFPLAAAVRRLVFIEEQGVPEAEEWDAFDAVASHLIVVHEGDVVAAGRFFDDGGRLHIGRIAVLPGWRGAGLGRLLVERCLAEGAKRGYAAAFLDAQCDKAGFYRRLGFMETGSVFLDAGIPHIRMERSL